MKKLVGIAIILFSINSYAEDIPPLSSHINDRPNWKSDSAELVYVGTRCGGVLDAVIWRFNDDKRPEIKKTKQMAKQMGDIFTFSTAALAEKTNFTSEGYTQKYKYWMNLYTSEAKDNLAKYNNIFEGLLGSDFKTCQQNIGVYKTLLSDLSK